MKLNFDNLKKIAVGAGIVIAPLLPTEAKGQTHQNVNNNSTKNVIKNPDSLNSYKDSYKSYMIDPSYKERLKREMFGDSQINDEKIIRVNDEYERRLKQIDNVILKNSPDSDIDRSNYDRFNNTITTTRTSAYHELSHSVDAEPGAVEVGIENNKHIIELNKEYTDCRYGKEYNDYKQNYIKFLEILKTYILEHKDTIKLNIPSEFTSGKPANEWFLGYLDDKNLYTWEHQPSTILKYFDTENREKICSANNKLINDISSFITKIIELRYNCKTTEIKARINYLRLRAIKEFNYNLDEKFDINNFKELKKDPEYLELRNEFKFTDEEISEITRYIAANNINSDNTYYHQKWNYSDENNIA